MLIKNPGYKEGLNPLVEEGVQPGAEFDFTILKLSAGKSQTFKSTKEACFVLIKGEITFEWAGRKEQCKREDPFHADPYALRVCHDTEVKITGIAADNEIAVIESKNDLTFDPYYYTPAECGSENRGAGLMQDAAARIVRNIVTLEKNQESRFFLGEVITFPGKWSSYPPHEHPQPEFYYFKMLPEDGYGFSEDGDNAFKTHDGDLGLYTNRDRHAQAAAPGYAVYYLWMVHNTIGNPHMGPENPEQFKWLSDPNAKIFPNDR